MTRALRLWPVLGILAAVGVLAYYQPAPICTSDADCQQQHPELTETH